MPQIFCKDTILWGLCRVRLKSEILSIWKSWFDFALCSAHTELPLALCPLVGILWFFPQRTQRATK